MLHHLQQPRVAREDALGTKRCILDASNLLVLKCQSLVSRRRRLWLMGTSTFSRAPWSKALDLLCSPHPGCEADWHQPMKGSMDRGHWKPQTPLPPFMALKTSLFDPAFHRPDLGDLAQSHMNSDATITCHRILKGLVV